MVESGDSLETLRQGMHKLPQTTVNVATKTPAEVAGCASIKVAAQDVESALNRRGRVVIRPSGTEPVVRITVEGEDAEEVRRHANALASIARLANGA